MRYRVKYQRINHIFISHLHGDHYLGLVGLLSSMHLQHRTNDLYLYGPPGLKEIITTQLKYSETDLRYRVIFKATNPDQDELILDEDKLTVTSVPLQHRIHCTGFLFREKPKPYRLDKNKVPRGIPLADIALLKQGKDVLDKDGGIQYAASEVSLPPRKSRSYAYCSDTIYDTELVKKVHGVDLLYHEATFLKDREAWAADTFHTTSEQAAKIASGANVARLVIGHFSARYREIQEFESEAREIFPETYLAREGEVFEIEE